MPSGRPYPVSYTHLDVYKRQVRELARVNMLEPVIDGYYRLGAAFVEFDRRTRMTDPFVQLGMPMLPDLVQQAGVPCVAVLARLYGDTVMCVADARSQGARVQTSYCLLYTSRCV